MRAVIKSMKMNQSVTVGAVTEKYFNVAKKERKICKDISTFCVRAEK